MDREQADNPLRLQWGRPQGQQVPPKRANPPPPQAISPHNAQCLEAIQNRQEHELRIERGGLNALRMLESVRKKTWLQSIEFSRILAEQTASDAAETAMQQRMNAEFNNQAKFVYSFLRRSIKRFWFCRNNKKRLDQHLSKENSWTENINMLTPGCHF